MKIDLSNMPAFPVLTKAERRKNCGACGHDIRGDRKARSSGLCYTCRCSIEDRGRPLVREDECDCTCSKHHRFRTVDDGQCGSPVGAGALGRRHTDCCFSLTDLQRPGSDPEFYKLFLPYYEEFKRRVEAERDRIRLEREERWRREGPGRNEVVAKARKLKADWSPRAAQDLKKLYDLDPNEVSRWIDEGEGKS